MHNTDSQLYYNLLDTAATLANLITTYWGVNKESLTWQWMISYGLGRGLNRMNASQLYCILFRHTNTIAGARNSGRSEGRDEPFEKPRGWKVGSSVLNVKSDPEFGGVGCRLKGYWLQFMDRRPLQQVAVFGVRLLQTVHFVKINPCCSSRPRCVLVDLATSVNSCEKAKRWTRCIKMFLTAFGVCVFEIITSSFERLTRFVVGSPMKTQTLAISISI